MLFYGLCTNLQLCSFDVEIVNALSIGVQLKLKRKLYCVVGCPDFYCETVRTTDFLGHRAAVESGRDDKYHSSIKDWFLKVNALCLVPCGFSVVTMVMATQNKTLETNVTSHRMRASSFLVTISNTGIPKKRTRLFFLRSIFS